MAVNHLILYFIIHLKDVKSTANCRDPREAGMLSAAVEYV